MRRYDPIISERHHSSIHNLEIMSIIEWMICEVTMFAEDNNIGMLSLDRTCVQVLDIVFPEWSCCRMINSIASNSERT